LKKSSTVPSKLTAQSSVVLGAAAARMTACPGAAVPPETALTSAVPNFWLYRLEHEGPQAALAALAMGAAAIPPRHAPPAMHRMAQGTGLRKMAS
jgi:hypothetical protein